MENELVPHKSKPALIARRLLRILTSFMILLAFLYLGNFMIESENQKLTLRKSKMAYEQVDNFKEVAEAFSFRNDNWLASSDIKIVIRNGVSMILYFSMVLVFGLYVMKKGKVANICILLMYFLMTGYIAYSCMYVKPSNFYQFKTKAQVVSQYPDGYWKLKSIGIQDEHNIALRPNPERELGSEVEIFMIASAHSNEVYAVSLAPIEGLETR